MNLSKSICKLFKQQNITHIFAMSGANNEILLEEIHRDDFFDLTIVKNETNAVFMAMGHYLKSKKIAAVITTSGAAILNTISPIVEAHSSKIPLLVIGGQIEQQFEGLGAFQDNSGNGNSVDVLEFFKPATIYQKRITDIDDSIDHLQKAINTSREERLPSIILIPKNLLKAEVKDFNFDSAPTKRIKLKDIDLSNIDLVIAGEELIHLDNQTRLKTLANETNSKVALTPVTKGLFDHHSSRFAGITGVMGSDTFTNELEKANRILLLGTNWDVITRFETENKLLEKSIISIGKTKHQIFCKDYESHNISSTQFVEEYFCLNNEVPTKPVQLNEKIDFNWKGIILTIDNALEDDADLFIDAGNTGAQCVQNLSPRGNSQFFLSLGQGGMGNSYGAAIGCSSTTKKRSYIFSGDGSFLISGLELHTAVENELPLCVFVFNNNSHGMCNVRESIFLNQKTDMNNFKPSKFAEGMKAMFQDIHAIEVNSIKDLDEGLKSLNENKDKFFIFNINISQIEIPPFKTFNKQMEINNANR